MKIPQVGLVLTKRTGEPRPCRGRRERVDQVASRRRGGRPRRRSRTQVPRGSCRSAAQGPVGCLESCVFEWKASRAQQRQRLLPFWLIRAVSWRAAGTCFNSGFAGAAAFGAREWQEVPGSRWPCSPARGSQGHALPERCRWHRA